MNEINIRKQNLLKIIYALLSGVLFILASIIQIRAKPDLLADKTGAVFGITFWALPIAIYIYSAIYELVKKKDCPPQFFIIALTVNLAAVLCSVFYRGAFAPSLFSPIIQNDIFLMSYMLNGILLMVSLLKGVINNLSLALLTIFMLFVLAVSACIEKRIIDSLLFFFSYFALVFITPNNMFYYKDEFFKAEKETEDEENEEFFEKF